jgi:NAD(P)-dependent dehydrogenase (short-subunit alcohol dehydrogenase family)
VNVIGFMKLAQAAMRYFLKRGSGHLVGITSVGLRGNCDAAAYAASKGVSIGVSGRPRELASKAGPRLPSRKHNRASSLRR